MTKILTKKDLYNLWEKYSIQLPEEEKRGLSTTGLRVLVHACFQTDEMGYTQKPEYPFNLQPDDIKDHIIAMLATHPDGKKFVDMFVETCIAYGVIQIYGEKLEG